MLPLLESNESFSKQMRRSFCKSRVPMSDAQFLEKMCGFLDRELWDVSGNCMKYFSNVIPRLKTSNIAHTNVSVGDKGPTGHAKMCEGGNHRCLNKKNVLETRI